MNKRLFYVDVEVTPGEGCQMPTSMKGAVVNCYTFAIQKNQAKSKVKSVLKEDNYILMSINSCYEVTVEELKSTEDITKNEINKLIDLDDVYYGAFHGWNEE